MFYKVVFDHLPPAFLADGIRMCPGVPGRIRCRLDDSELGLGENDPTPGDSGERKRVPAPVSNHPGKPEQELQ